MNAAREANHRLGHVVRHVLVEEERKQRHLSRRGRIELGGLERRHASRRGESQPNPGERLHHDPQIGRRLCGRARARVQVVNCGANLDVAGRGERRVVGFDGGEEGAVRNDDAREDVAVLELFVEGVEDATHLIERVAAAKGQLGADGAVVLEPAQQQQLRGRVQE